MNIVNSSEHSEAESFVGILSKGPPGEGYKTYPAVIFDPQPGEGLETGQVCEDLACFSGHCLMDISTPEPQMRGPQGPSCMARPGHTSDTSWIDT